MVLEVLYVMTRISIYQIRNGMLSHYTSIVAKFLRNYGERFKYLHIIFFLPKTCNQYASVVLFNMISFPFYEDKLKVLE